MSNQGNERGPESWRFRSQTDPSAEWVEVEPNRSRAGDEAEALGSPGSDRKFIRVRPGLIEATAEIGQPEGGIGFLWNRAWRFLVGKPIPTSSSIHERLNNFQALAVLSSDALSSVAYGPEQVFLQLMLAGYAAMRYGVWIGIAIAVLMVIVGMSYRQTIRGYPSGGGSYIVAKDNLGDLPGLIAAASLMLDYVLTVAVSVSAGVQAITSAFPSLFGDRVLIGLIFVGLMMLGNLRGVRESGAIFAAPTYLFIVAMYALIVLGLGKYLLAGGQVAALPHPPIHAIEGLSLFLILRSFASGCSAMTGMEAISNGVPAFKAPESEHARTTLTVMVTILASMFLGVMALAILYQAVPDPTGNETMVSMIARGIVGTGPFYFFIQATTTLILILGANTSYADFPRLASLLARDRFIPRQFAYRGDRLAFSVGIFVLTLFSAILIIIFGGITDALIPLYAIGVFVSFTLSQSGMVIHWRKLREEGWRASMLLNGTGAVATGIVSIVIIVAKFSEGAWIVVLIIPLAVLNFVAIHHHYQSVYRQIHVSDAPTSADRPDEAIVSPPLPGEKSGENVFLVPMGNVNRATLRTLRYALSLSPKVTVVHVSSGPEDVERFERKLRAWWPDARLVEIESPYRLLVTPLLAYVDALRERYPEKTITVVVPEFLVAHWWEHPLHNQTALRLKAGLLYRDRVAVISVPFHIH